jgi:hypothetical protein
MDYQGNRLFKIVDIYTNLISDGLNFSETIVSITLIIVFAAILWILMWGLVKISEEFFQTIQILIQACESVLINLFSGIKRCLKKIIDFGRPED